ncbi:hypothetical protein P280DRAFT_396832 [Massarina eburnea CBS 473.64]|uniref:Cytochrome b5 heme-binding domain-containing protein n=1 Tax=Massarina eburnea CBS 473.64 TaxID=1395130 RepID=A0A6A6S3Q5_9PLEO|nr:hypothetical protein P280DRAFT_396832 [Massarina eburnea CBS 473.64]
MSSAARYRRPTATSPSPSPEPEPSKPLKEVADAPTPPSTRGGGLSLLDILRVLGGILFLSSGISYLSTSGESMTWGYNPWWTRAREWKGVFNRPISLTDTQLLAYDGTDATKPILLALNGTIYDVSASPTTYGPGGSYHFFAGRDAARAFLTGCFATDAVPDLRGVVQMFLPVEPWERDIPSDVSAVERLKMEKEALIAKHRFQMLSKGDLKIRREKELRMARAKVREGLEHWHQLFRGDKGKPYRKVGEVRREEGWLEGFEKRALCEQAEKGRPVRKYE